MGNFLPSCIIIIIYSKVISCQSFDFDINPTFTSKKWLKKFAKWFREIQEIDHET